MGIGTSGRMNHTGLIQPGLSVSETMVNTETEETVVVPVCSAHGLEDTDVNPWFSINISVEANTHTHQHM